MERMFFLVNGVLYVPGYLYLRRYYDELLPFLYEKIKITPVFMAPLLSLWC